MLSKEEINNNCNHNRETYLIMASKHNNEKVIDYLLKEGENINYQNSEGNTALHYASCQGNIETMEKLIKHQADIEIQNYFHETPMMVACRFKQREAIKCLLNHHANTSFIDIYLYRSYLSYEFKNKEQDEYIYMIMKKYEEISEPTTEYYMTTRTLIERMRVFYNRPIYKDRYNNIEKILKEGFEEIVDMVMDSIS